MPRAVWVGYERERLVRLHADVETVANTGSPTRLPRHFYDTHRHQDAWPRVDDAIVSYAVFHALREEGGIPAGPRFQIGSLLRHSALTDFMAGFAAD